MRRSLRCLLLGLGLSLPWGAGAALAHEKDGAAPAADEVAIWKAFLAHVQDLGRGEVVARWTTPAEEGGTPPLPDFGRGDPILPVLFKLSNELLRLDALMAQSPEAEGAPAETDEAQAKRAATARELAEQLSKSEDPYLKAYGDYYRARLQQARGERREAAALYGALARSPHFLAKGRAHRELAGHYLAEGDATLAILELQMYLAGLSSGDLSERQWAEHELERIRDAGNKGPLAESIERAEAVSSRLKDGAQALAEGGAAAAQHEQARLEDVLEKTIALLERSPSRCPSCQAAQMPCGRSDCKDGSGTKAESAAAGGADSQRRAAATLDEQRRLEDVLEKLITIGEGSGKRCQTCGMMPCKSACKKCGACAVAGTCPNGHQPGRGAGDPNGNRPSDEHARQTKIDEGKHDEVERRDGDKDQEAWGRINDRAVARSLRELWNKIPVSYRSRVAQYFKDITELEPSEKSNDGK